MQLDSHALLLLKSLPDAKTCNVNPLDFTTLLVLRDKGLVLTSLDNARVVATRTPKGNQLAQRALTARV
jgi:hypothetical protein